MNSESELNIRPRPDAVLTDIADYVCDYVIDRSDAYRTARYSFNDALDCALEALDYLECRLTSTPEAFGAFIRSEIARWAPVVKAVGVEAP